MGYEMSVYVIEKIGDVIFEVERVMYENYDVLIVVGGDGILNEVVNGIVEKFNCFKLGVIFMGIVNDFGCVLYIFNDIMGVFDVIIEGYFIKVDIGKMNNWYFINLVVGG